MTTRTILVVEDDPNDENLTLRALRQSGLSCSVIVAHTGQEALHFLMRTGPFDGRTSPNPVLVFVDNTLPGFGGIDLVRTIRKDTHLAAVPIVVFSGTSDLNIVERCNQAGANSFIEKPIEMNDFIGQVASAARYWLTLNVCPRVPADHASAI